MKMRLFTALAVVALLAGPAGAVTPQQEKMKTCNAEAAQKKLSGDARKTFMSDCLSAEHAEHTTLTSQQQRQRHRPEPEGPTARGVHVGLPQEVSRRSR